MADAGLERCLTFIHCQLQSAHGAKLTGNGHERWRAVTLSRQYGAGGHVVAERLAELLQARAASPCAWQVFDRNLVQKVLELHHLPTRFAKFMPEDRISEVKDTLDELFGLHPPAWALIHKTAETILHLAKMGNVILLGRGAHVITRRLDYVFHVRLVASLEKRVERIQKAEGLSKKAAAAFVRKEDRGRQRYLRKYFDKDIADPLLYHVVLNTDLLGLEETALTIANAMFPGH
ncbi:putative cytidylate kinase [Verrucomicrobia bacterium]|nr:putative cytidylate kinase [Verrucomicrobiota bacterium]